MTLTRKRTTARLLAFVLAALMVFGVFASSLTQVFAATDTVEEKDKQGNTWAYTYDTDTKEITAIGVTDKDGNDITATAVATAGLNPMPKWLVGAKYSVTDKTDNAIDQIISGMEVQADIAAATTSLNGLIKIVNTVIGVLAVFILTLIGILTAIDVLYLEVPALHNSMDTKAMDKGQTNKSGGVKPHIVSEDASQAYSEAMENGKNPMIIYLKKRVVAYIAVAIVLYMLLSGNLALIVKVVLKALNGVFGWFEEYSATM